MILYLDTSSLVKLYVEEKSSQHVQSLVSKATIISTSLVAYAEARAAFARKRAEDGFSAAALKRISEDLNRDWESYYVIEVTDGLVRTAGDIAEKHLLRGFDSIHLSSAINLKRKIGSDVFFSSHDERLNRAASKEGLTIV
jgi:predicted nucleic acid-binding protein